MSPKMLQMKLRKMRLHSQKHFQFTQFSVWWAALLWLLPVHAFHHGLLCFRPFGVFLTKFFRHAILEVYGFLALCSFWFHAWARREIQENSIFRTIRTPIGFSQNLSQVILLQLVQPSRIVFFSFLCAFIIHSFGLCPLGTFSLWCWGILNRVESCS